MKENVGSFIREHHLLEEGDRVLVAFSGGADSLAMLYLLEDLAKDQGFSLGVCHVNHMLRGAAADADAAFAEGTAAALGRPFHSVKVDVAAYAREHGLSLEAAGRACRYAYFKEVMVKEGYDKCCLAHNLNDQAETLLLQLFRGAGLKGLAAMEVRRGPFVRPILFMERKDILQVLEEKGLVPREDATNQENMFRRNRLRNVVMPYLEEHFQPELPKRLARTAASLRRDLDYLEEEARLLLKRHGNLEVRPDGIHVTLSPAVFQLHEAMVRRVVLTAMEAVKGNRMDLEENHVEAVIALAKGGTGKRVDIKDGVLAENDYGHIRLRHGDGADEGPVARRIRISEAGDIRVGHRRVRIRPLEEPGRTEEGFLLDADVLGDAVLLRTRCPGDRMRPLGLGGSRKVKDILIDRKVSRQERDRLLILEAGGRIALLDNLVMGEEFRVTPHTKNVVQITIMQEESNDRK